MMSKIDLALGNQGISPLKTKGPILIVLAPRPVQNGRSWIIQLIKLAYVNSLIIENSICNVKIRS